MYRRLAHVATASLCRRGTVAAAATVTAAASHVAARSTPSRHYFFFSQPQHRRASAASEDVAAAAAAAASVPSLAAAPAADAEPPSPSSSHAAVQAGIEGELQTLRGSYLEPYDDVYRFLTPFKSTTPMVMLLGNHSSGKSTLINYLSGREIQETGVAPTDDGFTVIRRDSYDMDADGPSVVSNPGYQYQSLQQFGLTFVTHFKMKTRAMPDTSQIPMDMVLVDTPGMIDTPVHSSASVPGRSGDHTRGYDFLAVTRWFAQQSDVILLMFDPANPGTTGETLDVLTKSLTGYEHKFFLVMNKADVFEKVTDFARAYGTLCWNLSKVMKMKDIPRVYTTCTPLGKRTTTTATATATAATPAATGTVPAEELSRQRQEILREIRAAPMRRMDNLITETEESTRNLLLACRAAKVLRQDYRQREMLVYGGLGGACVLGPAAAVALSSVSLTGTMVVVLLSVALGCGGLVGARLYLRELDRRLLQSCDSVLGRLFTSKTLTKDVEVRWQRTVKPELLRIAAAAHDNGSCGVTALPTCSGRAGRGMKYVIEQEVPALRRKVSEYKEGYFRKQSSAAASSRS
ncbi:50S ribosome-binding GTPase/Dynamin family [Novymonas esmeraldas]|uniref:50S ribosome-binding GTPase/Dynamin family n=1 Tax=Novymonas esmeraldas TaxID=1808958 RepID=A0AAW0EU60_9TRYP